MDNTELTLEDYADMLAELTCDVMVIKDSEIFIDIVYVPIDDDTYFWYSWALSTGKQNYEK